MHNENNLIYESNGYRLIYLPEHPRANQDSVNGWKGFVYEHIVAAEEMLGRPLRKEEIVHHLNGDTMNNKNINLLVLERSQHAKLHIWINSCAPGIEKLRENGENSLKADFNTVAYCEVCNRTLQNQQKKFCSNSCNGISKNRVTKPSKEILEQDVNSMSILAVGRKYNVSDNAIRKWMKSYGIKKPTMSRAGDISPEGAETSGEVESS